jgi:hypothetical protein
MDNLVFNCTDALPIPATPGCPTDYGERIVAIAFMKKGSTFTVASSDYPTAAEFQTAMTAGTITLIKGISNGHRIKQSSTTLSGDDTVTGGEEEYDKIMRIEGRIKVFNEAIKHATKKIDRYSELVGWCFTDKNYVYGGKTGYKGVPNFDDPIHEGKGQPPYIPFTFDYATVGLDQAGYDANFATLSNA